MRRAIHRFDDAVERRLDRVRGHRVLDRTFYAASALAEFSLIWHLVGLLQALLPGREPLSALRLSVIVLVEGLLVNGLVKQLFRRTRPEWTREEARPHHLRIPLTSSFPSGHASAAFCAAAVLTASGDPLWPAYYALAAVVASSRCWVRIHHASDVLGGAVVGTLIGLAANQLWAPY